MNGKLNRTLSSEPKDITPSKMHLTTLSVNRENNTLKGLNTTKLNQKNYSASTMADFSGGKKKL